METYGITNTSRNLKARGHTRSASLENANSLMAKNTLGLPIIQPGFTGTLKSKNEQRRLKNKFGSHNNLEDYVGHRKSKFQNLRNMFEMKSEFENISSIQKQQQQHNEEPPSGLEFNDNLSIVETSMRLQSADHVESNNEQVKNIVRPIAFKPIPFEPDYSIPNRYNELCDRYGSTPSLVPPQGSNMRFGSTQDLRHGGYNSYCSNLLARRRCSRALKMNDSMESIRHTPDSDAPCYNSSIKSTNNYLQGQFDMTPSPSDSGVSDLEAALKDRDSEIFYLRQTMEHNEKVIFKVHKDKEAYWDQEIRRLKAFYENQQKDHILKIKKLEQMLTLQSFQFRQNKLRLTDDTNRLKDQFCDLKNENDLLRKETDELRFADKTLKDRINQLDEKSEIMDKLIENLKNQLEENEWTVCQKNGEIALLKIQLKEAKVEINLKDHELLHMKSEAINRMHLENEFHKKGETKRENDTDLEISQLNRIVILKDQVIVALKNELAKLRKEFSDLEIFREYGEEPNGKYARLKYKIDSLTSICGGRTDSDQYSSIHLVDQAKTDAKENELEIILNCLKTTSPFIEKSDDEIYAKISSWSLNDLSNSNQCSDQSNLPDITLNLKNECCEDQRNQGLRKELELARITFEREKEQWAEEKEKVLKYQRQLQMHYINMYQKMKDLENKLTKT